MPTDLERTRQRQDGDYETPILRPAPDRPIPAWDDPDASPPGE
jgi:hypothetical protein